MVLKQEDYVGRKFGKLTAIDVEFTDGYGSLVVCKCDCGSIVKCKNHNLESGGTTSCGCSRIKHGITSSRTYVCWRAMRYRCRNPNAHEWKHYGGRGIKVCDRWKKFENFLADMGQVPDGHTLDRIDVNGDYTPENCRWATHEVQHNNRRDNRFLTLNGKTQSVTLWAREYGMEPRTLFNRLDRSGMTLEVALRKPLTRKKKVLNTTLLC